MAYRPILYRLDEIVYVCGALASGLRFLSFDEIALLIPMLAIVAVLFTERGRWLDGSE